MSEPCFLYPRVIGMSGQASSTGVVDVKRGTFEVFTVIFPLQNSEMSTVSIDSW